MNTVKTSLVVLALFASTAHADSFERQWPQTPEDQGPSLGAVVAEKVLDASNKFLATHVDRLSLDTINVRIDGVRKAAKLGVGAGKRKWLSMRVGSDIEVVDGTADVKARLSLAIAGKQLDVKLPTINVASADVEGQRGVEVKLPLLRKAF